MITCCWTQSCARTSRLSFKKTILCTKTKPLLTSFNYNKQTTLQEEQLPKAKAKTAKAKASPHPKADASTTASSSSARASPDGSKLRLARGKDQSYIQLQNSKEEGRVLLVSLSATMALRHGGKNHQEVMTSIHAEINRRQIVSKPEAVALRDMMLQDVPEDLG